VSTVEVHKFYSFLSAKIEILNQSTGRVGTIATAGKKIFKRYHRNSTARTAALGRDAFLFNCYPVSYRQECRFAKEIGYRGAPFFF
jgi:hypothetical protein